MNPPDATRDGYSWHPWEDDATKVTRLEAELAATRAEVLMLRGEMVRRAGDTEAA